MTICGGVHGQMKKALTLFLPVLFFLGSANTFAAPKKSELWVYTSIYKEFIAPIEAEFEKANPDVDLQVFQGGSEKIQAKVEAEILAKSLQADILLTSDPFWSADLAKRGMAHARNGKQYEMNYYSLMVLIANKSMPAAARPAAFGDLIKPEFKNLIQMGSPLESGTTFSAVAYLSDKMGWSYFEKLKANGVASSGGNSTVIQKVESGEKKIGMVLLENALAAIKRGSPIEIIYPSDGGVAIPSMQVILKNAKNLAAAERFAAFILSKDGQKLLRNGYMYAVDSSVSSPEGAKSFKEATAKSKLWKLEDLAAISAKSKSIKTRFSEIVLE